MLTKIRHTAPVEVHVPPLDTIHHPGRARTTTEVLHQEAALTEVDLQVPEVHQELPHPEHQRIKVLEAVPVPPVHTGVLEAAQEVHNRTEVLLQDQAAINPLVVPVAEVAVATEVLDHPDHHRLLRDDHLQAHQEVEEGVNKSNKNQYRDKNHLQ